MKNTSVDQNTFFRLATLEICGNLQIEQAMRNTLNYLKTYIPIDRMYLQIFEPDLGAMRTMATASASRAEPRDQITPLPPSAREQVRQNLERDLDRAVIVDDPLSHPTARVMLKTHGILGWSVSRMTLSTESGRLGGIIFTARGSNRYTEEHMQMLSLLHKPFTIAFSNALQHRELARLRDHLADDNQYLRKELRAQADRTIIGADLGLKEVMRLAGQVAPTDSPVLITGATGVGKDVIANYIHQHSRRHDKPFMAINCGAIPENLIDSELFGHMRGAFTGAIDTKRGRFERAQQGSVFLDEIGEMPLSAQIRLLRVLQNKEIEPVGGSEVISVDIRVIAATNRNLADLITLGKFREDLWFRLNVFPIEIPPLSNRIQDIPALVRHLVEKKSAQLKIPSVPKLAPGAMEHLAGYHWPGNVRELENVIERAIIVSGGAPLRFDLTDALDPDREAPSKVPDAGLFLSLDEVVASHIRSALKQTNRRIHGPNGAAALLRINANTLRHRMTKLGIPFKKRKD